ncbi:hypothetical protein CKSOR_00435 [Candidatus Kinetoplastibacterium sorsogonicusi]|uniref:DNA polymerase III subunit chi n=1 Tax=Candidatus Kinetoplastidibacterium kentomonadis TaxID=1576550 RepID=A0A3S7JA52_9PROT|nr:DNA polymerase III subunit chi [Candidatus Kinetoplastibacterium sorsogonicusi]AWD32548.1 hypothetical protein CKSOR_00435 [Candidatus Kinetoplastibacterium sorsogonicusi]
MNKVNFIYEVDNKQLTTCKIVNNLYTMINCRIVIVFDEYESMKILDKFLWSFDDISFIPHAIFSENLDEFMPIILMNDQSKLINKNIYKNYNTIINLTENFYVHFLNFKTIFEIVSKEESDKSKARKRWKEYKQRSYCEINSYKNNYILNS